MDLLDLPLGVDLDFLRTHPGGSFLGRSGGVFFRDHPRGWISFFCGTFRGWGGGGGDYYGMRSTH